MDAFAGTSGYSFQEWRGHFYPEKLPPAEMLRYYAARLPTVEINNTFYRMPGREMLARWANEVPDGFRFALKAPRRITHDKRLRETEGDVAEFLGRAEVMGGRLGAVLFQLPPFMKKDVPLLAGFLAALPAGRSVAFEFRNASWQDEAVYEALRARGAALCVADTDKGDTSVVATASYGYLRLRRERYSEAELRRWVEQVRAQPWKHAYVYFQHEDEALGTAFARSFGELWRAG